MSGPYGSSALPSRSATGVAFVLVPLLSILCAEVWDLTVHLRFPTAPADPLRTMRAVQYSEHGNSTVLQFNSSVPAPMLPAAAGYVVVKVVAAALNPVDFKMRRNAQPFLLVPKPYIPGYDVAGIVVGVGADVTRFSEGDAVYGMLPLVGGRWGALAEFTAAHETVWAKAPTGIALEQAAALPLVGLTVQQVVGQAKARQQRQQHPTASVS